MRSISKYTLCALVACALPAPALAASSDTLLKLGDIKGEADARGGHKDWIEVQSWSWGTSNGRKGWDGSIKGRTVGEKYGAVSGAHRDADLASGVQVHDVVSPRDAASGMPTGKRQHGWMPVAQTLDRGSIRVKVKFPWLDCKVGAAFPDATLQDAAASYAFKDVVVTSCPGASSGGDQPMESLSLSYSKVVVRGWDPSKKEE